ncbi:MAG: hypothetical protein ILA26_07475 [Methanobrevibacter sp.]|uniref:hypothetical protein n=1 Tax=Methanobrevibacter sp. TaxID=66852 RepID=UPI001B62D133|nr:hypothetical protein [Methanobrevibacter sp.]MBP3791853.1 hypothetical protein [Methanobrevibacter sp.]
MRTCPNCSRSINESFTYCWRCGCNLEENSLGDFTTPHMNVFRQDEDYIYIFSVHGRQVVLKASSIDELRMLAHMNKFPWKDTEIEDLN